MEWFDIPNISADVLFNPVFLLSFTFAISILFYITRAHWLPTVQAASSQVSSSISSMISKVRPSQYERLGFGSFRRRGATDLERDGAGSSSLSPSASSSFLADYRAGFSSNTFSLLGNIEGGDGRAGLDNKAKDQIARIMQQNEGMTFDEARKVYLDKMMLENNIGPDGRPNDPKAFFFS